MKKILILISLFIAFSWNLLSALPEDKIITLILKSGRIITGKMISFDTDKNTITLDNNGKPVVYDYNTNATGDYAVDHVFKGILKQCDSNEKQENNNESGNSSIYTPVWFSYMSNLQNKIRSKWHPEKQLLTSKTILRFNVSKNGMLNKISVYKSSGDQTIDNAAIKAVQAAAPFDHLPSNFTGSSIDIQFSFDYKIGVKHF